MKDNTYKPDENDMLHPNDLSKAAGTMNWIRDTQLKQLEYEIRKSTEKQSTKHLVL